MILIFYIFFFFFFFILFFFLIYRVTEYDKDGSPIDPDLMGFKNLDEYLANIDTKLTPEKRVHSFIHIYMHNIHI